MMRRGCAVLLVLAAAPAAAQVSAPPGSDTKDIIVIGKRTQESARDLAACIARHCPPNQEIDASLALAQDQFRDGDYHAARTSLLESRARNAKFAKQYPVAVANLYHASGVIARNLGLADSEWSSALDTVSAMKAGMSSDDPRVFLERIELGDALARAGRFDGSEEQFSDVAKRARARGLKQIEGTALLRVAILNVRLATQRPSLYARPARHAIDAVLALKDPAFAPFVQAASQLRIQFDGQSGHVADMDKEIAAYQPQPAGAAPLLLYAPQVTLRPTSGIESTSGFDPESGTLNDTSLLRVQMDSVEDQWVDVAFEIGADGRVSDAHIAKQAPHLQTEWADHVVRAVAARRYAPQAMASNTTARFTLTANFGSQTGSHIPARSAVPRLESVDLND